MFYLMEDVLVRLSNIKYEKGVFKIILGIS